MWNKRESVVAVTCLVVGSVGQLVQYVVSPEWEVVAADVGEDFAYLLAIERTTASIGGSKPTRYTLRSTTIFRREKGEWKIVHGHADPIDHSAALLVRSLGNE